MSLHPPLRKCWMKRGQTKLIPAPGIQRWTHVFGAYNWRTDDVSWTIAPRKNSEAFITFLEHLMSECYPTQKVVLVLDNATFHTSRASLAAMSSFVHRLQVVWLPKYSPFLNPIERYWLHLKNLACANKLYVDLDHLRQQVERSLMQQNLPNFNDRFSLLKNLRTTA